MACDVRQVSLWPGLEHPLMTIHSPTAIPPMHRMAAMLVFRGGAYRINNGSGQGCAEWFAQRGVVGIAVEYRTVEGPGQCKTDGRLFPKPIQDGARAVRLVRKLAPELNVDPNRIGVCGFSAGGHLSTMLCGTELPCQDAAEDDLTEVSFRPDVCVLGYPLISFMPELGGPSNLSNSAMNLGCLEGDEELLSAEFRVSQGHPPTFIWHTREDEIVPVAQSEAYAKALQERGVPHQVLFVDRGPHALGLALDGEFVNDWTDQMFAWLGKWASPQLCVTAPSL